MSKLKILKSEKYKRRGLIIENRDFLKEITNDQSIIAFMEERTAISEGDKRYEEIVIRFQSKLKG